MLSQSKITARFQKQLKRLAIYLAASVITVGILVIVGWQFNLEYFKRILPGIVAMNPATAICFIIGGMTIIVHSKTEGSSKTQFTLKSLSLLISFIGISCLLTNLFGIEKGIDHWFFAEKLSKEVSTNNRMAPNTAFNFIITGISLFLLVNKSRHHYKTFQNLALIISLISILSIVGYIYGVRSFYGILTYIPMAIHSSFCFLFISCAILLSSCDKGIIANYTSNYVGSILARKLIPYIVVCPILLGSVIVYGEKAGLYITHFGTALFTSANIIIFAFLIKKIQISVNKADVARTAAENKLKEINGQLEDRSISLEILNKELESFSYSISHDLKAPLRTIQGFTKILQINYADKFDEDGKNTTDSIIHSSNKMSQLIDDLLEFSIIRQKELQNERCKMRQIVENVIKAYSPIQENKKIDIRIHVLPDSLGDPKMIEQVWVNLISNAVKYSSKKDKPIIEIGSYINTSETIYFVKDNGVGFDMNYAHKLFIVFQRLHSANEFEGTGVGLSIVHRIISRHRGRIWAEGKKEEGACFYFSLPSITEIPEKSVI